MRDVPQLLFLVASVGNLFLATLVIFRARRARGALPIALLCLSLFVWDISEAAKPREGDSDWLYIRLIGSSMAPAFLWHFVVVFVHKERTHRKVLTILYAITAVFTLMTAGALVNGAMRGFVRSVAWNLAYLASLFPFLVWSFILVRARRREAETAVERNAANFVAFGIAVGVLTGLTELVNVIWPSVPRLGHAGSALCTLVLAVAILRHRLLEQQTPIRTLSFMFLLTASAVVVILVIFRVLPERYDPYVVFGAAGGVAMLALYRMVFVRLYEQAERRKRLALIGTMAAGVAHEIRNPLAAIKGAAQFVQKDLEGTTGKEEAKEYLQLLVNEVDRLNGVVESFLTYARPLEPRRQDVSLDSFLSDLVKLQAASLPPSIRIDTAFEADLPPVQADPALLATAVSNVVRNAVEVMPDGGTLAIRTRTVVTALRTYAAVDVADSGPGIPRAERERIFQPFYTTKAKGTGLGLAIALRILEAHGGDIAVENLHPRGCRFTLLLPLPIL